MITKNITIINKLGLHARAAAKFVATASKYTSELTVIKNGQQEVNGKSIMGVMMLAASKGTQLEVKVNGDDETALLEAIESLVNNFFDEKE